MGQELQSSQSPAPLSAAGDAFRIVRQVDGCEEIEELAKRDLEIWSICPPFLGCGRDLDLLRKSGEFPMKNEELHDAKETIYERV